MSFYKGGGEMGMFRNKNWLENNTGATKTPQNAHVLVQLDFEVERVEKLAVPISATWP